MKALNRDTTRMTEGPIGAEIIAFTVPLFIGNLFQQLYNTADALIVGNFVGNEALAAVSSTGSLVNMLVSFFGGLSAGAGVAISRYYGARDAERLSKAVHTNITLGFIATAVLTLLGAFFTPVLLRWMDTPADIFEMAADYVRIYFLGSIGLVFYNTLRGMMQAVGDSRNPLIYLIVSSLTNVVLDLIFITCFDMGVPGAAIATVISQLLSAVLCLFRLMRTDEDYRVSPSSLCLDRIMFRQIIEYGLPGGLQNSVISIANVVVQANINAFGTMAVAGCGAYTKIEGFAFLPISSFVIALTTFVGQNLGAGEHERAKEGARFGLLWGIISAEAIGFAVFLLAPLLIRAFTAEPDAVYYGVLKSRACAPFFFLLSASHCLASILRGAGKAVVPMVVMLSIWCVFRVTFLSVLVPIYHSIALVNWVYPITWFLSTVVLTIYYLKADWIHAFDGIRA